MKSKTVSILFVLAALLLAAAFFLTRRFVSNNDKSLSRAKIVTPRAASSGSSASPSP